MDKYRVIRSNRKTMSLEITRDGEILVRAPLRMSNARIESFVKEKHSWIEAHRTKVLQRKEQVEQLPGFSANDLHEMAEEALKVIPERVKYFAPIVGVTYHGITIRNQKTRWGSCSSKGNLNFNCLLMKVPGEVLDYVVVHELCHRLEMNHSPRFWAEVERVLPDYKNRQAWLKKEGGRLIGQMLRGAE